jgi:hypothetical protein
MTIKAFAWAYNFVSAWLSWVQGLPSWQAVKRIFDDFIHWAHKLKHVGRFGAFFSTPVHQHALAQPLSYPMSEKGHSPRYVRFTPESDHSRHESELTRSAKSKHRTTYTNGLKE